MIRTPIFINKNLITILPVFICLNLQGRLTFMKVLIASDFFAPTINGVVTSILNLQNELEKHGHEVKILTLRQKESYGYEDCVYAIPSFSAGKFYPGARVMRSLASVELKELKEWKPDVIHTNNEFSTFLLSQLIAAKLNVPIVHTYHTVYEDYIHYFSPSETVGKGLVKRYSKTLLERTDAVIVPTEKVRALLNRYKVGTPVYTVPTGIDLENFAKGDPVKARKNLRTKYGVAENEFILLSLGRLAKEKNIEEIIRFLKKVDKEVRLMIVGGGPYQNVLENFVLEQGLKDRVIFSGMVRPEEVPDHYHMADAFVSGSTSETQGLTYVEALACGLPAICRKDDAIDEVIINDLNGWQYETEQEFVDAVTRLIDDPMEWKRMSEGALTIAQNFSTQAFYEGIIAVYEAAINGPRKPREPIPAKLRQILYKSIDLTFDDWMYHDHLRL